MNQRRRRTEHRIRRLYRESQEGGRGDGVQVMVAGGYAYVGTRVQRGITGW